MYRKAYPDLQKEKQYRNGQELAGRQETVKKDKEQYKKTGELRSFINPA